MILPTRARSSVFAATLALLAAPARSSAPPQVALELVELGTSAGPLLPHRIEALDRHGRPGGRLVEVRSIDDLALHVTERNGVLPPAPLPATPGLELRATFDGELDPSNLDGAFLVEELDPRMRGSIAVPGRLTLSGGTLTFQADRDGDPGTLEPLGRPGRVLRVRIGAGVASLDGRVLAQRAAVTVPVEGTHGGPWPDQDLPGRLAPLAPADGSAPIDPSAPIVIAFSESLQPSSVGPLSGWVAGQGGVRLAHGPAGRESAMPWTARPLGPMDLTTWEFLPEAPFPGGEAPGDFDRLVVSVVPGGVHSLDGRVVEDEAWTELRLGSGPRVINAPVAPDAIYLGSAGGGLSVLDLNGFGGGTGDPTYDPLAVVEGNSNYPNNPNVRFQGALLRPPLQPGTSTVDGGSAGVFTLTRDSSLGTTLLAAPEIAGIADMALGHALDSLFDAGLGFGCQSGGSLCAQDGLKQIVVPGSGILLPPGTENVISWAPHPNPPPRGLLPICASPAIPSQEPTSRDSALQGLANLLVPGDPFGDPAAGIPPSGLFARTQNAFFEGPSLPAGSILQCSPYGIRGQVGQFLYLLDGRRDELVVVNSNTQRVLGRIALPRPTELAMSPNLDLLAVSCAASDLVCFVDIDPASATFHQVVKQVPVGRAPRGIAWEGGNEDILVCNELDGTLSILSALSLSVRKTVGAGVDRPFAVVTTPRQAGFGFERNVYFGYVLGRDGRVSVFESGPAGPNGWGYDDVIGLVNGTFPRPRALHIDPTELGSSAWVAHLLPGPAGPQGALSRFEVVSQVVGMVPLPPGSSPMFRAMSVEVAEVVDGSVLSGIPLDLAFDDLDNLGILPNRPSLFGAGSPALVNGKDPVRQPSPGLLVPARNPRVMLVAIAGTGGQPGLVDVLDREQPGHPRLDVNPFQPGVQSVPAPGVAVLMDYFRQ